MWNKNKSNSEKQREGASGWGKWEDVSQRVQIFQLKDE